MGKRYRRQKLAKEPKNTRGYRTVNAGSHRVKVALLPGGKTKATSVLHPKGEKRDDRRCSVCGLRGHDRRKHDIRQIVNGKSRRIK
ncbi:MAG: hypothetical protein M1343_06965 [Chloroflexi bacterium]|nr:hypothetical protein [Chloroflexota bacterium]MDA8186838.1 hypothetical protein [Dehalococcoidales bacterium]